MKWTEGAIVLAFILLAMGFSLILKEGITSPTGYVTTTVTANITESIQTNCTYTIPAGKNLVSFYCILRNDSLSLITYNANFNRMFTYDASDSSDPWKAHMEDLPAFVVSDIANLDRQKAYWVFSDGAIDFNKEGFIVTGQTLPLVVGWNLVGMVNNDEVALGTLFNSLNGNYEVVYSYNNTAKVDLVYDPNNSSATSFNYSEPFLGYWIYMNASDTWSP